MVPVQSGEYYTVVDESKDGTRWKTTSEGITGTHQSLLFSIFFLAAHFSPFGARRWRIVFSGEACSNSSFACEHQMAAANLYLHGGSRFLCLRIFSAQRWLVRLRGCSSRSAVSVLFASENQTLREEFLTKVGNFRSLSLSDGCASWLFLQLSDSLRMVPFRDGYPSTNGRVRRELS